MRLTLILLLSVLVSFGNGQNEVNSFNSDGEKEGLWIERSEEMVSRGQYVSGKKEGLWKSNYSIKNLSHASKIEEYQNGVYHGTVYNINYNGQLISEENYSEGRLSGMSVFYEKHGGLERKMNYLDGQLDGETEIYYATGAIQEKGNYSKGKRDGLTQWFNEQSQLIMSSTYNLGVLDGPQRLFENARLSAEGNYKNNQKIGLWKQYDASGKVIREEKF